MVIMTEAEVQLLDIEFVMDFFELRFHSDAANVDPNGRVLLEQFLQVMCEPWPR